MSCHVSIQHWISYYFRVPALSPARPHIALQANTRAASRLFYCCNSVALTPRHRLMVVPEYQPRCYDSRRDRCARVSVMTPDEILKAFNNIRVWQRGDRRAPPRSGVPRKGPARLRIPLLRLRAWPAAQAPANRPRGRAHKVVSGRRAGRRAEWPCLMLAAPQGFRSRRIHHPPGRLRHGVQPASSRQRRKAALVPRSKYSASSKFFLSAA